MTDKEIIKALEYYQSIDIIKSGLDLINRQQAENSSLTSDLTSLQNDLTSAKAEIERLNSDLRIWKDIAYRETEYVEITESEAIKNYLETCEKTAISNTAKVAKAKFLEMAGEK